MQICYITQYSSISLNPGEWIGSGIDSLGGIIEGAVSNAIDNCIVKPFQGWCYGVWCGFVDVSLPICTTASLISLMLCMIGVKKAKQWIIIPIIAYLFLRLADVMITGGVHCWN